MPLSLFHPAVAEWFSSAFESPTEPQRMGWPAIQSGRDTLIAAPTGSGKTLAAFLWSIDSLIRQGTLGAIPDELEVVYVSPLKALSNDVKQNLAIPLSGVEAVLRNQGLPAPEIRVWVRTGDTPASERQKMTRKPPHILVTTPESLYILLTAEKSRKLFRGVRTVIVDEIHAVARDKRGSHLALTLERLDAIATHKPVRIGLSATQSPIEEVARFLVGTRRIDSNGHPRCTVVNTGHARRMDLAIEVPGSPLSAVCSNETWEEIYDRIARLIEAERTTLVFVNTRRLAERVTLHLSKRLGENRITSHHGSMSRRHRLQAEMRLKSGDLKALVATASLELGIDIGTVDLVCQIGSPRSIATLLQRVGRSGHSVGAVPRGRVFALSRDELIECAALLRAVRRGRLDRLHIPEKPLDILAQQIVASVAAEEWKEDALYDLCLGAYPYRHLSRQEFDEVVRMLAEGFSTRRGRSRAHLHYDAVHKRIRARKGARLAAITSGGAIPDNADYRVILEPEGVLVGTVNEDFAVESMSGDIFQLGNNSWRILKIETGVMRVEDARGEPPSIPFWLGEGPARTAELSAEVSEIRGEVEKRLEPVSQSDGASIQWLKDEPGLNEPEAMQIVEYLAASRNVLGVVPTQKTIVLERFFDTTGGMQLIVHAPFGARINRAWGLALRKRFCRSFNFELQAAATDDSIVLSLGLQHSFPLDEVFTYLNSKTAQDLLVQALLAAPMFQSRWRWNAMRALAILRSSGGRKIPAAFLRMKSDDLLATVFPDSAACAENLTGPICIPDHPLVRQTIHDCLTEAMDCESFLALLRSMEQGKLRLVARDTTEPSPLSHEVLNAKPYAFLDDAPLEERRARAVQTRHNLDYKPDDMDKLDSAAIQTVREQAWPQAENPDELHDALMLAGFVGSEEQREWRSYFDLLAMAGRATELDTGAGPKLWVAAERKAQFDLVYPHARYSPYITAPTGATGQSRDEALVEIVRGRMEILGPVTAASIAASMGLRTDEIETALAALEKEGFVFRGHFTGLPELEWCDRRLLARIHRATLDRLRKEIEPVTAAEFMRFLFSWQHADPDFRLDGPLGLSAIAGMLQGFEIPAAAWESAILPARMVRYDPAWMDQLCLSGELAWARLFQPAESEVRRPGANRASPISLVFRDQMQAWLQFASAHSNGQNPLSNGTGLGSSAVLLLQYLQRQGACFFQELVLGTGLLRTEVEAALRELIAGGYVTADGFAALRALVIAPDKALGTATSKHKDGRPGNLPVIPPSAGRWSLLRRPNGSHGETSSFAVGLSHEVTVPRRENALAVATNTDGTDFDIVELCAWQLLRRYGVVFHRLLERESGLPPWRELLYRFRRMEARGEIRGGRFVSGFSGEQYALPEAVQELRAVRRRAPSGMIISISAVDPLNLAGVITPGEKIAAVATNRVLYRDGIPVAAREAGAVIELHASASELRREVESRLQQRFAV
ncbi:MAG: DEAD/DEAH box helicase [Acidobacteria bacterium]|nr:DEAD/DEAH box helicase [Acidobacteriota bacterium]